MYSAPQCGAFLYLHTTYVCAIFRLFVKKIILNGGVVEDSTLSFMDKAAEFSMRTLSGGLQLVGKIAHEGGFSGTWVGSDIEGDATRGTRVISIDGAFNGDVKICAILRVRCIRGVWKQGVAEIWYLGKREKNEQTRWRFYGRLNTQDELLVYKLK